MPLTPVVVPGYVFNANTAFDADDLNAAAKPSVTISGSIANGDLEAGAVTTTNVTPGAYFYAADTTGATNGYVATLSPALGSLANGTAVYVKIRSGTTNTSASTLNVNGLGAVNIKRTGGAALHPGDIRANYIHAFQYNSSTPAWELLNPANPDVRQCPTSAGAAGAYTLTTDPVVTALYTGCRVVWKCHVDCDATPTLAVDGLTAKALRKHDDTAIAALELQQNALVDVIYDAAANGAAGAWLVVGTMSDLSKPTGTMTAFYIPRANSGATGTEWVKPQIIQSSVTTAALEANTNVLIPNDDTKPQKTEGAEYMTKAFTPLSATSHLLIEFDVYARVDGAASYCALALFQDDTADALAVSGANFEDGEGGTIRLVYDMVSGTTSAMTFKIRFGPDGGGERMYLGSTTGGNFADTMFYVLRITEYIA